jgi:3-dehydroquinate dehydratase-2
MPDDLGRADLERAVALDKKAQPLARRLHRLHGMGSCSRAADGAERDRRRGGVVEEVENGSGASEAFVLVVHGPNLNLLGTRETDVYGTQTLADIDAGAERSRGRARRRDRNVQSNSEGDIVSALQRSRGQYDGVLINPAALQAHSVAIRDAVLALDVPVVEVHLSNIYKREEFRKKSLLADVVAGADHGIRAVELSAPGCARSPS